MENTNELVQELLQNSLKNMWGQGFVDGLKVMRETLEAAVQQYVDAGQSPEGAVVEVSQLLEFLNTTITDSELKLTKE